MAEHLCLMPDSSTYIATCKQRPTSGETLRDGVGATDREQMKGSNVLGILIGLVIPYADTDLGCQDPQVLCHACMQCARGPAFQFLRAAGDP